MDVMLLHHNIPFNNVIYFKTFVHPSVWGEALRKCVSQKHITKQPTGLKSLCLNPEYATLIIKPASLLFQLHAHETPIFHITQLLENKPCKLTKSLRLKNIEVEL